jgi:hypothetical protein
MWYEDGKYLKKINTFTDFIACAEHLIKVGMNKKLTACMQCGHRLVAHCKACLEHLMKVCMYKG